MHFRLTTAPLACAILLATSVAATAAGIDCSRARSQSEMAICGDKELVGLDAQLSKLYSQARHASGISASQKKWLGTATACAANTDCLKSAYATRISELRERLKSVQAYQPDAVDELALAELRQAIAQAFKVNGEMGLPQALAALTFKSGTTKFRNVRESDSSFDNARFPTRRPTGVTPDEWQALNRSKIESDGENGSASYTLLDMDGDGKRDLIVDTYGGGTGLWNYVNVLRRQGDRFVSRLPRALGEAPDPGDDALYSLNGRGANQAAYWVKLQGRIYVAYFEGAYGEDRVNLLQPLQINGATPTLTVRYAYTLSVPRKQKSESDPKQIVLSTSQQSALMKGLATVSRSKASQDGVSGKPLCPVPAGTSKDDRDSYTSFGPDHYTYEIVGDFAVWYGKECRIGRLSDWFGTYGKEGLNTMLSVRKADGSGTEESFNVIGRRRVTGIESSTGAGKP